MIFGNLGEPIKIPLPHISGSDVSGTVIDIGENVLHIKKEKE
jgi:alcohol dehydrogenase